MCINVRRALLVHLCNVSNLPLEGFYFGCLTLMAIQFKQNHLILDLFSFFLKASRKCFFHCASEHSLGEVILNSKYDGLFELIYSWLLFNPQAFHLHWWVGAVWGILFPWGDHWLKHFAFHSLYVSHFQRL